MPSECRNRQWAVWKRFKQFLVSQLFICFTFFSFLFYGWTASVWCSWGISPLYSLEVEIVYIGKFTWATGSWESSLLLSKFKISSLKLWESYSMKKMFIPRTFFQDFFYNLHALCINETLNRSFWSLSPILNFWFLFFKTKSQYFQPSFPFK